MIECYAQRLLNPYRGVVHTIRYQSAEAVTTDGVEWDIYVANDALLEGLGRAGRRAQISDIRYGHWSAETGLKRGALYPSEDFRRLEEMGAVVYEHLLKVHRDVPFTFRDYFELWLLDARNRPLALLHSVLTETDTEADAPLDWRAGIAAQTQFSSSALPQSHDTPGAYLTRHINSLVGRTQAQWFVRTDEGLGLGLRVVKGAESLKGRVLEAELFPPFYIATDGMGLCACATGAGLSRLAIAGHAAVAESGCHYSLYDGSTCATLPRSYRKTPPALSACCRPRSAASRTRGSGIKP